MDALVGFENCSNGRGAEIPELPAQDDYEPVAKSNCFSTCLKKQT